MEPALLSFPPACGQQGSDRLMLKNIYSISRFYLPRRRYQETPGRGTHPDPGPRHRSGLQVLLVREPGGAGATLLPPGSPAPSPAWSSSPTSRWTRAPRSVELMPDGHHVYVNDLYAHTNFIFDIDNYTRTMSIPLPDEPVEMDFHPRRQGSLGLPLQLGPRCW